MTQQTNRQLRLRERPTGRIDENTFGLVEAEVPAPGRGQALVRNIILSIDPTNRVWIRPEPSYLPPVEVGAVMRGGGIGRVVASNNDLYPEGSLVVGLLGWQDYALIGEGQDALALPVPATDLSLETLIGVLGVTGTTAYFGIEDVGRPEAGETVVVSAAAGAVGSIAGQLAKRRGARVIGIAGGQEKCHWLVEELRFDAAVDRHAQDWEQQLEAACPDGIDLDFENVGGAVMDKVFSLLNLHSRVALCGLIAAYNEEEMPPGPRNFAVLLTRRVRLQGFLIFDYLARHQEAIDKLTEWLLAGEIKQRNTIVEGLERAPETVNMLFDGRNVGKLLLRVAEDALEPV